MSEHIEFHDERLADARQIFDGHIASQIEQANSLGSGDVPGIFTITPGEDWSAEKFADVAARIDLDAVDLISEMAAPLGEEASMRVFSVLLRAASGAGQRRMAFSSDRDPAAAERAIDDAQGMPLVFRDEIEEGHEVAAAVMAFDMSLAETVAQNAAEELAAEFGGAWTFDIEEGG